MIVTNALVRRVARGEIKLSFFQVMLSFLRTPVADAPVLPRVHSSEPAPGATASEAAAARKPPALPVTAALPGATQFEILSYLFVSNLEALYLTSSAFSHLVASHLLFAQRIT